MIKIITHEEIQPLWQELWPNTENHLRKVSSLTSLFDYDLEQKKAEPVFWGYYHDDQLVAGNSGFTATNNGFCFRGLYVKENFRNKGIAKKILNEMLIYAKQNHKFAWTLPRITSLPIYEKVGFVRVSEFTNKNMDFGPNCLAVKVF